MPILFADNRCNMHILSTINIVYDLIKLLIKLNRMGGSFLSQPITTKRTKKYQHHKVRVITCEMQGIYSLMQDGANIWKMLYSSIESIKISIYSQYSTVTEESKFLSSVPKNCHKFYNSMRHF